VRKKLNRRKAETDSKREFNEQWENELLFIAGPSRKPLCIVCEKLFHKIEGMILRDTIKYNIRLKLKGNSSLCLDPS